MEYNAGGKMRYIERLFKDLAKMRIDYNDFRKLKKKYLGEPMHLRKRYYFGYGYACIQAIGKGKPEKMTQFQALVTCKNCKRKFK